MKNVIMFTSQTCSSCKVAKNFLFQNKIQFEQKDINVDAKAREELFRRNISGVPTFQIGKDFVTGFDPKKILKLVDHRLVECKKCSTKIRVPINKGTIKIKCMQCAHEFSVDTQV
ncbi:glutaredoxin family protein [Desulfosporosinus fructosivorans]|uniref:Glutaredoxin family protein n=1 Tax=Desulfosporosinus fructosivorans TaxID=2018669 RepID=A0A4Z0R7Q8_9FIRM|nr:glutaredoxin family protein [Desulfosporosinus fructosivorans]